MSLFHLYELLNTVKLIKAENIIVVTRGCRIGEVSCEGKRKKKVYLGSGSSGGTGPLRVLWTC